MTIFQELFDFLKDEANTANAIATISSAIAAVLALLVSAISVFISVRTLKHQREHNILSVKPLPEITVADYENSLRVKIRNNGSGPMIIQSLSVTDGKKQYESIIDCMPELTERYWTHFSHVIRDRTIFPGAEIVLLELTEEPDELGFSRSRELVRHALAPLHVSAKYTDVYKTDFPSYTKALDWFGRHVQPAVKT